MAEPDLRAFAFEISGKQRAGLSADGVLHDLTWILSEWPGIEDSDLPDQPRLQDIVSAGLFSLGFLRDVWNFAFESSVAENARLAGEPHFLPPVTRPQKIICLGRNYAAHAREAGHEVPHEPTFFAKAPSALLGHGGKVILPRLSNRVDYEAELALVVGKRAKNVAEEKAWEYVAGYTALNDVTARDLQKEDIDRANPWFRSKSFDTFCPMGPWLIPRQAIADPHSLSIELRLNGKLKQSASTSDMIFGIDQLVSYISRHMTLCPGDVIATGTPEGIGKLQAGDEVEVSIENVGILTNRVIAG